jgi:hypothetical protein
MDPHGHWMLGFADIATTDLAMKKTAPNASLELDLGPAAPFAAAGPSVNLMGSVDLSGLNWAAQATDAFA